MGWCILNDIDIAKCGMNCSLCIAFQRDKNRCNGCNSDNLIRKSCLHCYFKKCEKAERFCFQCVDFPCLRLKRLDARYRTNYNMSMVQNLIEIKDSGMDVFLNDQVHKYTCNVCHNIRSVHVQGCNHCFAKSDKQ